MNLNSAFTKYCFDKKLLVNKNQKSVINLLSKFNYNNESSFLAFVKLFFKKSKKKIFYLSGDVGVGKTMILDFFLIL